MKETNKLRGYALPVITGVAVGAAAVLLTVLGNPANMGFCIACFLRDIAGALNFQQAGLDPETGTGIVQYIRPEIIGLVLGACAMALFKKEFRPKGGSAPMVRFIIAVFVMIGALVFLGCPLRMVIRIGGGDLNALVGLAGFVIGILIGIVFLRRGFSLRRAYPQTQAEGWMLPAAMIGLLVLAVAAPAFIKFSQTGPGSQHAALLAALAVAFVVGALAQRARLCMAGGLRDVFLFRDFKLLYGFAAIFVLVLIGNLAAGTFSPGFALQPVSHSAHLWNFLGMALVGWGSVLLGGCPLRQLILAGEGNGDSALTVLGMMAGAAISHNFGLAGNADALNEAGELVVGGVSAAGKAAVILGFLVCLAVSVLNLPRKEESV